MLSPSLRPRFDPLCSLTRYVLGPTDDDDQLAVGEVTQSGERSLSGVRLQGVRHGEQLLRLRHEKVGHDDVGGACVTKCTDRQRVTVMHRYKRGFIVVR